MPFFLMLMTSCGKEQREVADEKKNAEEQLEIAENEEEFRITQRPVGRIYKAPNVGARFDLLHFMSPN